MLAASREKLRKEDTRQKIELGGLVIKAGLDDEDKNVILGLLIAAATALSGPDGEAARRRFREDGIRAFSQQEYL